MGGKKLQRFRENFESGIVIEPGTEHFETIKGQWNNTQFDNRHPIVLELACGRGEYTTGLARVFPEKNFIGVDIKGARIWKGMKLAKAEGLANVAFLRTQIDHLNRFFSRGEVDEIWIIHPDPRPKNRDEKRRLTSLKYLQIYRQVLKKGRWVHLKTDNDGLFEYSLELLQSLPYVQELQYTRDLYHSPYKKDHFDIETRYELQFVQKGCTIKYLKFRLV